MTGVSMNSNSVLVLGSYRNKNLIEVIFDAGFVPIVRETMQSALTELRHERYTAILVDQDRADVDTLEFVLNVRDINKGIPIVVTGDSVAEESDGAITSQPNILILSRASSAEQLTRELDKVVGAE